MEETELEMVERHVREGARRLRRQQEILEELREDGLPTERAEQLLTIFIQTQAMHEEHLAKLRDKASRD